MKIIPEETCVEGEPEEWDEEIKALWEEEIEPEFKEGEWCSCANFFRPRRYKSIYDRGSTKAGFVYTVQPGNCVVCWSKQVLDEPLGTPGRRDDGS